MERKEPPHNHTAIAAHSAENLPLISRPVSSQGENLESETVAIAAWLDPKIVVPAVCVVLASVIVPILLHYLKGKREREEKLLEIRTLLSG
jgi:hypothetical protein